MTSIAMSLKSLLSQLLYDDETYSSQSDGGTSTSTTKKPIKKEFEGETQYCFKNTVPIETKRYVEEFNPNGENVTASNPLNGTLIETITVNSNVEIPLKRIDEETLVKIEKDGRYIVFIFSPDNENAEYQGTTNNWPNGTNDRLRGVYWLVLKKWVDNKVTYDTNQYHIPQPLFSVFISILNDTPYPTKVNTDGKISIYSFYGSTKKDIVAGYTCDTCREFNPIRTGSYVRYIDDISNFVGKKREKRNRSDKERAIITETQDGFWRIATENFKIKVKISIEGWGIMGGPFNNWLVESGFKTVEENYVYERDGKQIRAVTITTPHPTRQVGKWDPGIGPIWYTGKLMALSPGDYVNVWYSEDEWLLANSIYAKNFTTDLQREFSFTASSSEFLFRMNKLGELGRILNDPGRSVLRYVTGGFGQIDSSVYTGLAIYLRFQVINPQYQVTFEQRVDKTDPYWNAFSGVGQRAYSDHNTYINVVGYGSLVQQGLMSGYPKKTHEFDAAVTYTVLLPSDPEFTTGGWEYQESITAPLYDSIRELNSRINELIAKNNISDITSSVMSVISLATSFPSLFSGVVDAMKSALNFLKKIKKSNPKIMLKRISFGKKVTINGKEKTISTPTFLKSITENTPDPKFANLLTDDETFSILHGISNAAKKRSHGRQEIVDNITDPVVIDPIAATKITTSTPHVLATSKQITPEVEKALAEIVPNIKNNDLIEFSQINNTISTLKNGYLAKYAIDEDVLDYVISSMGNGHIRTLFSLNLRKQIIQSKKKDGMVHWNSQEVIDKILNDRELLDVTGNLTTELIDTLYKEFTEMLSSVLGD